MRPGPARGTTVTTNIVVGSDMSARIDGREIHPVYGTGALVADIERICRGILEPHLEDGEEAVGARLEILHRSPVPIGETIALTATVATVGPLTLVCEILVRHGGSNVARGSFEQRLVRHDEFLAEADSRRTVPTA
jgi:fluoroacetyl-CoA thioesterase